MSENTKQEFQDLIRTLSEEICKDVLLEDMKKINADFKDIAKSYEEASDRFFQEVNGAHEELAAFGDAAQNLRQFAESLNENARRVDNALDFIQVENQKQLEEVRQRYESLFGQYEDGIRKFTDERRAEMFSSFREELQSAGSQYIDDFRDMLTQQNTEVLIRSLANLSEQLMDLSGEKDRLRRELSEVCGAVMRDNTRPAENDLKASTEQVAQLLGDMLITSEDIRSTLDNFQSTADTICKLAGDIESSGQAVRDAMALIDSGNQRLIDQMMEDNKRLFEAHARQLKALDDQQRDGLMESLRRELDQFSAAYINGLKVMLQKQDVSHLPANIDEINAFFQDIRQDKKGLIRSIEKICEDVLEKNINRSGQSLTRASVQVLGLSNDMRHSAVKIQETLNSFHETVQTIQRQTDAVLEDGAQVREALQMIREGHERMFADYTEKLFLLSETERRELVAAFNQNISEIFLESVTSIQNCLEMDALEQLGQVIEESSREMARQEKIEIELGEQLQRTQKAIASMDMRTATIHAQNQKYIEDLHGAVNALGQEIAAMHRQDQNSLSALLDVVVKMKEDGKKAQKRVFGALCGVGGLLLATLAGVAFSLLRG